MAPYPMVVGSRLPDQASASIHTVAITPVNATNGTRRWSMAPSVPTGGNRTTCTTNAATSRLSRSASRSRKAYRGPHPAVGRPTPPTGTAVGVVAAGAAPTVGSPAW